MPLNIGDCGKTHVGGDTDPVDLPSLTEDLEKLVSLRQTVQDAQDEIDKLQAKIMRAMQDKEVAQCGQYQVKWPMRTYKAQPEKVTPAKEARTIRLRTLQIKS